MSHSSHPRPVWHLQTNSNKYPFHIQYIYQYSYFQTVTCLWNMISTDIDLNTSTSKIQSTILTKIWSIFNSSSNTVPVFQFSAVCLCSHCISNQTNTATQCPFQHHHQFFFLLFGSRSRKEIYGVDSLTLRI